MGRTFPDNLPSKYELDKMPTMEAWWQNDVGHWMREYWPRRFELPVAACFGFTSNGSPSGNTALAEDHAPFSEVTHFGISGGWWQLPVPNRDTRVENHWFLLHNDARVIAMRGGEACMNVDCWLPQNGGLPDATAIGVCTLEDHYRSVVWSLPDDLKPTIVSPYQSMLFDWSWSAGPGRAANFVSNRHRVARDGATWVVIDIFNRVVARASNEGEATAIASQRMAEWATSLKSVPEVERNAWVGRQYARWAYDGVRGVQAYQHASPFHGWTRERQKERVAGSVDQMTRGAGAYWSQGYESAAEMVWIETVNAAAAGGIDPKSVVGPPPRASSKILPVAVGLTAALGILGVVEIAGRRTRR